MNDARAFARAAQKEPSIAPSGDTPSALSSLLGALSEDNAGSPDFNRMAAATGMDPDAFRRHAETLWRHMDSLADDPEAYQKFLSEKARDAGVDGFAPGGGGGGGAEAFPGSFLNTGEGNTRDANGADSTRTAPASTAGNRESSGVSGGGARATFLAPAPTRRRGSSRDDDHLGVGVVAVWLALESLESLVPSSSVSSREVPVRAKRGASVRVEKVALPDPRVAPEDTAPAPSLAALASAGAPPPMDATVYDVEAHPDAVARALEDPQYQALLIEAATRLAEAQDGVEFVRDPPGGRRCYARRGEAPARVAAAAAAAAADARRGGLGEGMEGMSASLLTEIAGMGLGDKSVKSESAFGRSAGEGKTTTTAPRLIEEVASSRSVRVERDAAGAPVLVSVTMHLPQLASMKDANLEVGARFITLDPGPGEPRAAVALPVAVDPDAARAKWTKKTRTLVIDAPPRE